MGLALSWQKAIVCAGTKTKVAMTDGSQEFCTVLETVSATVLVV